MKKIFFFFFFFRSINSFALEADAVLKKYNLEMNTGAFNKVIKHELVTGEVMNFADVLLMNSSTGSRLAIEVMFPISEADSLKLIKTKTALIYNLYRSQPTPYPGYVAAVVKCHQNFLPKTKFLKIENTLHRVLEIAATERDTYGECSKDLIRKKSTLLLFYSKKSKKLYQIKSFSLMENYKKDAVMQIYSTLRVVK